jgi:hypothetical protein
MVARPARRRLPGRIVQMLARLGPERGLDHATRKPREQPARPGDLLRFKTSDGAPFHTTRCHQTGRSPKPAALHARLRRTISDTTGAPAAEDKPASQPPLTRRLPGTSSSRPRRCQVRACFPRRTERVRRYGSSRSSRHSSARSSSRGSSSGSPSSPSVSSTVPYSRSRACLTRPSNASPCWRSARCCSCA